MLLNAMQVKIKLKGLKRKKVKIKQIMKMFFQAQKQK